MHLNIKISGNVREQYIKMRVEKEQNESVSQGTIERA